MLVRDEDAIRSAASGEDDLLAAASLMLREGLTNQRRYVRLVAHSALHGLSYDRTAGRFAATQRLVSSPRGYRRGRRWGDGADPAGSTPASSSPAWSRCSSAG